MFYKITLPPQLCLPFSQILVEHAEHSADKSNTQEVCYIAHSAWAAWYQSKCWAGRADLPRAIIICEAWVLLCIQVLSEGLKKDPTNQDLQELFHTFTAGRQLVVGRERQANG